MCIFIYIYIFICVCVYLHVSVGNYIIKFNLAPGHVKLDQATTFEPSAQSALWKVKSVSDGALLSQSQKIPGPSAMATAECRTC